LGWDKGVDFESVLKLILKNRAYAREFVRPRLLRAVNVALIQLVNGLRISEALECYYKFLLTRSVTLLSGLGKVKIDTGFV
jgi:hypothetical protein